MKCPTDSTDLVMADRQGIEIDYCPKCRGVWLDRGELDKIIEATTPVRSASARDPRESWSDRSDSRGHGGQGKRRKSLLGELFDF